MTEENNQLPNYADHRTCVKDLIETTITLHKTQVFPNMTTDQEEYMRERLASLVHSAHEQMAD